MTIILAIAAGIAIYYLIKVSNRRKAERLKARRDALIAKYGSEDIADKIIAKKIWQGMTTEQLGESWGKPQDIDDSVLKTKTKATWKYGRIAKNRYSQKVMIEDGQVVGWENK